MMKFKLLYFCCWAWSITIMVLQGVYSVSIIETDATEESAIVGNAIEESALRGSMREQNNRNLQSAARLEQSVKFLPFGDTSVAVRIKQTFVGKCVNGVPTDDKVARMFFAVYLDPDSGEEVCHFKANANPCYARTLVAGCDPETDFATIRVYAYSPSFNSTYAVPNPKVGSRCFPQDDEIVRKAKLVVATVNCNTVVYRSCTKNSDCETGKYCSEPVTYYGVTRRYCVPNDFPGWGN